MSDDLDKYSAGSMWIDPNGSILEIKQCSLLPPGETKYNLGYEIEVFCHTGPNEGWHIKGFPIEALEKYVELNTTAKVLYGKSI
jgi:hypothetical protein